VCDYVCMFRINISIFPDLPFRTHLFSNMMCFVCEGVRRCALYGEVGGWGRDPKICTGRDWGMGSSTI